MPININDTTEKKVIQVSRRETLERLTPQAGDSLQKQIDELKNQLRFEIITQPEAQLDFDSQ